MDIKQLELELSNLNVPNSYYSINGSLKTDAYILNKVYSKWEYFYFDEKGNKENYRIFDEESDACNYLLEKLKVELKYPPKAFK